MMMLKVKDDALFEVCDSSSNDEDMTSGYEDDQSVSSFPYCVLAYVHVFSACAIC